jgi:diguanylate cyclase (GGDEF)-like protein
MEDHYAAQARAEGRLADAQAHARRSIELVADFTRTSVEIGDSYNAWSGGHNHACCLFALGEHAVARDMLNQQLRELDGEAGFRRHLILQLLGDIEAAEGHTDLAIAHQTEALDIAARLQMPMFAMNACRSLVDALERNGEAHAALAQHRRYHDFYVQLASARAQAHARAMAVKYETEKTLALAEAERQRADRLALANTSLIEEKAQLQRTSMEDALTGLANRRHFDHAWAYALQEDALPPGRALALLDLDRFKCINDRFSHLVGDEVLRRLGALLQRVCRRHDLAARFGGEEFALILTGVDRAQALAACERVRAAVAGEPWLQLHPDLHVTVSIGVVHEEEASPPGQHNRLLATADARLYAAKRGGRNRVVGDDTASSSGPPPPAGAAAAPQRVSSSLLCPAAAAAGQNCWQSGPEARLLS